MPPDRQHDVQPLNASGCPLGAWARQQDASHQRGHAGLARASSHARSPPLRLGSAGGRDPHVVKAPAYTLASGGGDHDDVVHGDVDGNRLRDTFNITRGHECTHETATRSNFKLRS